MVGPCWTTWGLLDLAFYQSLGHLLAVIWDRSSSIAATSLSVSGPSGEGGQPCSWPYPTDRSSVAPVVPPVLEPLRLDEDGTSEASEHRCGSGATSQHGSSVRGPWWHAGLKLYQCHVFKFLHLFILFHNSTVLRCTKLFLIREWFSDMLWRNVLWRSFFLSVIRQSSTFDQQLHMATKRTVTLKEPNGRINWHEPAFFAVPFGSLELTLGTWRIMESFDDICMLKYDQICKLQGQCGNH